MVMRRIAPCKVSLRPPGARCLLYCSLPRGRGACWWALPNGSLFRHGFATGANRCGTTRPSPAPTKPASYRRDEFARSRISFTVCGCWSHSSGKGIGEAGSSSNRSVRNFTYQVTSWPLPAREAGVSLMSHHFEAEAFVQALAGVVRAGHNTVHRFDALCSA